MNQTRSKVWALGSTTALLLLQLALPALAGGEPAGADSNKTGQADTSKTETGPTNTGQIKMDQPESDREIADEAADIVTPQLEPFKFNYRIKAFGLSGDAVITLKATKNPNEYRYSSSTQATGLARLVRPNAVTETSLFTMRGATLLVGEYMFDSGSGDEQEDSYARFDWNAGIVYSNHQEERAEVPLTPGMLDRMSADLQVTLDLQAGRTPASYTMVHRNSAKTYTFSYEGSEPIKTAAGTFDALKYRRQREGSSREAYIWYAPELKYQPIKVVQLKNGKSNATLLLEAYSFGEATTP